MNRVKLYWNYATRSFQRGGQRTFLAIFCIAVGVMAIVSLQLVGNMVNTALTGNVRAASAAIYRSEMISLPLTPISLRTFSRLQADGTLTQLHRGSKRAGPCTGQRAASGFSSVCRGSGGLPSGWVCGL